MTVNVLYLVSCFLTQRKLWKHSPFSPIDQILDTSPQFQYEAEKKTGQIVFCPAQLISASAQQTKSTMIVNVHQAEKNEWLWTWLLYYMQPRAHVWRRLFSWWADCWAGSLEPRSPFLGAKIQNWLKMVREPNHPPKMHQVICCPCFSCQRESDLQVIPLQAPFRPWLWLWFKVEKPWWNHIVKSYQWIIYIYMYVCVCMYVYIYIYTF